MTLPAFCSLQGLPPVSSPIHSLCHHIPHVQLLTLDGSAGGEEHAKYKQQVVGMLKAGQLALQMLAAEEVITMPDGSRKATFLQDTWDMVRLPGLLLLSRLSLFPLSHY